jgi:hypothetical protein
LITSNKDSGLVPESVSISPDLLQTILAAVLKKYVPRNKKIELDLLKVHKDVYLDIYETSPGKIKIGWSDTDVVI